MHATEIVPRHVKGDHSFQVGELLAESVDQPPEPPQMHSEVEIRALHVAGADVPFVRVAGDRDWDRLDDLAGAVPVRACVIGLAYVNMVVRISNMLLEHYRKSGK